MSTGSGLDAQIGFAEQSTYDTPVTVARFLEFNSESLSQQLTWLEPTGLAAGRKHKRLNRAKVSRRSVSGEATLEHATKGMGLLWKHALASSAVPTLVGTTDANEQIHVPGDYRGKSLTVQVGRPEPSTGTVVPFTYTGCKIPGWSFSLSDGEVPTLAVTIDGRVEDTATALATAAYLADSSVFDFSDFTLKLGGTPSTTAGKTTVTGGTAVATVINSVSLSGESPMATERFGIGNAGNKNEPLENDIPTVTGSLEAEFSKTELYDVYDGEGETTLQLTATGELIEAGHNFTLDIILPGVKIKNAPVNVGGPDIVTMSTEIEAYDNEADPVIQVRIVSDETAL